LDCHICRKNTNFFIDEKTNIKYYYCQKCEYIFKSSEYYQDFVVQKKRYDLHKNDENSKSYEAYFQRFLDFIIPLIEDPKDALDFGCGASLLLSKMFKKYNIKCEGYDPIYFPDTLSTNKKYNLITSIEVFEHLYQPRVVFENLIQGLKKEGYLAIQTEFHPNNIDAFKKWYYHHDPTHIVFFTRKTFKILCEMTGCKIISDNGKNMILLKKY